MLLKGPPRQKYTVMATSCHEIIFHTSDSTGSFCFHSYFGGPFDIILTGSTVEKLVELHIFCIFLYNCFNKLLHLPHFKLMITLLVTCVIINLFFFQNLVNHTFSNNKLFFVFLLAFFELTKK